MVRPHSRIRHRAALTRACYITTALVNGLVWSAPAQETISKKDLEAQSPVRYGPFDIVFGLRAGMIYDDNIYIAPNKTADALWTISPNMLMGIGDYREKEANLLSLSYLPSVILFTDQTQNNAIDHDALLQAQWRPGAWKFGLQQAYQKYSGAVVDVGNRVNRQIYTTGLQANYEISPRTSVELDGRQSINDYQHLRSYNEWIVSGWVDYEVMPLLKAGLGLTGGFVDVHEGANQTYQQALA